MSDVNPDKAFEAFGRAMATVGALEQVMRLALAEHEVRRAEASKNTSADRLQAFSRRLLKMDFGRLADHVRDKFKLSEPLREGLKDAKIVRNYLAHDFWSPNYGNLRSERGLDIIIRHCASSERYLHLVAHHLIVTTGVDVGRYIQFVEENAGHQETFEGWEKHLIAVEEALAADEAAAGVKSGVKP